jgi:bifunctional non-homologous end joining protein LigD
LVADGFQPDPKTARHVVSPKSKLTKPIRKLRAVWVEPSFVAEVEYRDISSEGFLRQSSFKGLLRK